MTTNPTEDKVRGELEEVLKELIVASNGGYWYSYADKVEIKELGEALTTLETIVNRERVKELEEFAMTEYTDIEDMERGDLQENMEMLRNRIKELKGKK